MSGNERAHVGKLRLSGGALRRLRVLPQSQAFIQGVSLRHDKIRGVSAKNSVGSALSSLMSTFPPVQLAMRNAFRVEDWIHRSRVRSVRRRGYRMVVEPYTGYGSTEWVRVLARVQMAPPPRLVPKALARHRRHRERTVRGWRAFTRIAAAHATVTVKIGPHVHRVTSDRGGVIDINLPASLSPGWQEITFESADGFVTTAPVFIVDPKQRVGIVSDIDDTVMVTALPRPMLAAWNTFVLDVHARTTTPGMNVFDERLLDSYGHETTPVIYLSTGPWNVAPTLARFLSRNVYPAGPLLLTDWGPTPDRFFRSGYDHKVTNLHRLAKEFPHIQWILIGDDGQHDEEIYGNFAREFPEHVKAVAIRRLSASEAILAQGARGILGEDDRMEHRVEVPWFSAPDGAGLIEAFREAGLLSEPAAQRTAEEKREEFIAEIEARESTYDPE